MVFKLNLYELGRQYAITNSSIKASVFLLQSSDKLLKVYYVTANRFMYNLGCITGIVDLLCVHVH